MALPNLSRIILCQKVRELHSLYTYIYIFWVVIYEEVFAHSCLVSSIPI